MKREIAINFEFVEYIPEELKEHTLYISNTYGTAVHRCLCGCGREVVTPLSPTAWRLTFDGKTVSLSPSIGSWSLPCQSHYFITKSKAIWAPKWSKEQIDAGRAREAKARDRYFKSRTESSQVPIADSSPPQVRKGIWAWIKSWIS